ncbi:MAG TPA: penicillin-binding protein 2 [Gaiellaceae bacterium]|nr:penicillin-binding protein 2 [Gaiellaceae bacterium]
MNKQINRVAVAALVLLASLIVATTYWQSWAAAGLEDRQDNAIQRVAQFEIKRGNIYAADGHTYLARRVLRKVKGKKLYFRRYPEGPRTAHVVGYSTAVRSRAGLERSMNDYLTASNANLNTVLDTTLDKLRGATIEGNDLILSLRPGAQKLAYEQLGGRCGSVVALEPKTGRVLVMANSPSFDPNLLDKPGGYAKILKTQAPCSSPSPLVNRATFGHYIPGSIFKVVTASAGLDTGKYRPESTFVDPGYCVEYGRKVTNYSDQSGAEVFGLVNLVQALVNSINSVFCNIGKQMGPKPIVDYMKRYGFYSVPPLETPVNERRASGLFKDGKPFQPENAGQVDPGRLAFGQERLQVTPLQMAMVAAGVANGGVVMEPYVVQRIRAPDGTVIRKTKPHDLGRAVSPETAATLTEMMTQVVQSGTGTAAQIPGVQVAGKTGTAETGVAGRNTVWFITFAPADDPKVAIAVVLEGQNGTGGQFAAPIAKAVLQALLPSRPNT